MKEVAEEVGGRFRSNYSGRSMFGKTCCGIDCDNAQTVIELLAERGLTGSRQDQMGKGYIVYWPSVSTDEL